MFMLIGILCLLFLCGSVLIVASFPITQYQKNNLQKNNSNKKIKDYYSHLFDVY
jgi:ABC-type microcin C transport system permease subunit YejB